MTQRQLEDLFWRATVMCLGLDPDSEDEAVHKRVRISWPTSETGNSNWGREENVVFLRISPGYDTYGTLHDIDHVYDPETDTQKEVVRYHRSHRIVWVCYGPDSDDDADTIRIGIVRDAVHSYLKASNVAILPHIREPVRVPEQDETGEWWERCDLEADFYQLVTREYPEDFIQTAPEINIQHG
ncbi:MAG: hypothetical protein IJ893_02765 [Bacteroidales bacterium]|nr:hypothetical protein [Clostridia bacterium]MBQ6120866.1 hypothetical protein [Clostridia bacterium]MBR2226772.1 hypothetical protein [Bacteroidales bacterium]